METEPKISRRKTMKAGAATLVGLTAASGSATASTTEKACLKIKPGPCNGLFTAYLKQLELAQNAKTKNQIVHHLSLARALLKQWEECRLKHGKK